MKFSIGKELSEFPHYWTILKESDLKQCCFRFRIMVRNSVVHHISERWTDVRWPIGELLDCSNKFSSYQVSWNIYGAESASKSMKTRLFTISRFYNSKAQSSIDVIKMLRFEMCAWNRIIWIVSIRCKAKKCLGESSAAPFAPVVLFEVTSRGKHDQKASAQTRFYIKLVKSATTTFSMLLFMIDFEWYRHKIAREPIWR